MDEKTIHIHQPERLTVAEFRKQMKMALDYCVQGGTIEIDRMGQTFVLMYQPRGTAILRGNILPDDGGSHNIRPDVQSVAAELSEPPTPVEDVKANIEAIMSPEKNTAEPDGFKEAGAKDLLPCCKLKTPCKHWQFDSDRSLWVNTINGDTREVET